jgi:hypothetical protein
LWRKHFDVCDVLIAGALAFGASSFTSAVPAPKDQPEDLYFATRVGDKWVYEEVINGMQSERIEVVTKVEKRNKESIVTTFLEHEGKRLPSTRTLTLVSSKGLFCLGLGPDEFKRPWCRIKFPANPGMSWKEPDQLPGSPYKEIEYTIVGEEDAVVPAGKFRCIRVDSRVEDGGWSTWYAAGIGVVKLTYNKVGAAGYSCRLSSFAKAKN